MSLVEIDGGRFAIAGLVLTADRDVVDVQRASSFVAMGNYADLDARPAATPSIS